MKAPDKIFITPVGTWDTKHIPDLEDNIYIRKDALLEWAEKEMDRLWGLLPDADNHNPSKMELRYLGQYMQMETFIDKINSL